jgi:pyrroloquinoline-quinone synthase
MDPSHATALIETSLEGRRLLGHPFYRRWEAGELTAGELADYAAQYAHVEACLPGVLAETADALPEGAARDAVRATLADEQGRPVSHVELFAGFSRAVGARSAAPTPATEALVDVYRTAARPVGALAVLGAYEVQAAAIARTKADGLRAHYGLDDTGTAFWDVHAALEETHAAWTADALADLGADSADVAREARRSADAWWAFLDEREAAA